MKMNYKLIAAVASIVLITGCSVKTERLENDELRNLAKLDLEAIYAMQEPVSGALTLTGAIARALKYNLENRVKLMEQALAHGDFRNAKKEMMPLLAASAGYVTRNNYYGSSSLSLITGRESLEPSTSQEKSHEMADIRATWNILDFGVSYLQARQTSDRYHISEQARRSVMLRLLQQVRSAYWRAATMQRYEEQTRQMTLLVKKHLAELEKVREEQLRPPLTVLGDMRTLIEILQQLEQMQDQINAARVELATLVNLPPGSDVKLDISENYIDVLPMEGDVESLEVLALSNSPEFISQAYNQRIEQLESRKSLMRLFPGIEFSYGANYDSNSFLVNETWHEAGVRVTQNLMQLLFIDQTRDYNNARSMLTHARRLAINMAIITKLHLSWQDYQNTVRRLDRARQLSDVDSEISMLTQGARNIEAVSGVKNIQDAIRAYRSRLAHSLAYAEAQDSFGTLVMSLGIDPVPDSYQDMGLEELTSYLDDRMSAWNSFRIDLTGEFRSEEDMSPRTAGLRPNRDNTAARVVRNNDGLQLMLDDSLFILP